MKTQKCKVVNVAIPCYKSASMIGAVVDEVRNSIMMREGFDYRIILVNDYPYDATFDVISQICREDSKIIGVNLSQNFGQPYAKMAALEYFDGDVLVYMDDDGQHPGSDIYELVDKIIEGYDVAYAYFPHKRHSAFKRGTSALNGKLSEINGTKPKGIFVSSYYALSKFMVQHLKEYRSPFPSVNGYMNSLTSNYVNVEMPHRKRLSGSSNYTLKKLLSHWALSFFNYTMLPLRVASYLGSICAAISFLYGVVLVIRKLALGNVEAGYTSIVASIFFVGGLIMLMLGIIGEYIGRIYMTVSDKPQYAIREVVKSGNFGGTHGKNEEGCEAGGTKEELR